MPVNLASGLCEAAIVLLVTISLSPCANSKLADYYKDYLKIVDSLGY